MKWLTNLFDTDFLLRNWKAIMVGIVCLLIGCIVTLLVLFSNLNTANEQTEIKEQEKQESVEQQRLEQQQTLLEENLTEAFTFGELTYETPVINSDNAFLNTSDSMLGSYKDYILFSTVNEGLYFYNAKNGHKNFVTDQSILNTLANDKLFYIEILSGLEKEIISYDIESGEKKSLMNLSYRENVTEIAANHKHLYYILRENGVNHLQSLPHTIDITSEEASLSVQVPDNSFLVQDGDKSYLVNSEGYYFLNGTKVIRLGSTPKIDITSAKMWLGVPLIYGYNSVTGKSELYYGDKLLKSSDFIFGYAPITDNYLLINSENELYILELDTMNTKTIGSLVADFVVLNDGDIIFRTSMHTHDETESDEDHGDPYFYLKRK